MSFFIKVGMEISKRQGVERELGIRFHSLPCPNIRIDDKSPFEIPIIANHQRCRPHKVKGLFQPLFISGKQVCIIGCIGPPGTPTVRRTYHIGHHHYVVLSLPETEGPAPSSSIRDFKLSQTVVTVKDFQECLGVMLADNSICL